MKSLKTLLFLLLLFIGSGSIVSAQTTCSPIPILNAPSTDYCEGEAFDLTSLESSITTESGTFEYITKSKPRLYLPNYLDGKVKVLDVLSNTVIKTIQLSPYYQTVGVTVSPDGSRVYITSHTKVFEINTITNTVTNSISVDTYARGIDITPDGAYAYVAHYTSHKVSVINLVTSNVITTVNVGNSPTGVVVSPDGAYVYVANDGGKSISVIQTSDNTVIATISLGDNNPSAIDISPDGTRVYTTNPFDDNVSVIQTSDNTVLTTIAVGDVPNAIAVSPDGTLIYVANQNSSSISVIDAATNTVSTSIPGSFSFGIDFNAEGDTAYGSSYFGGSVTTIDVATSTVTNTNNTLGFGIRGLGEFYQQTNNPIADPENYIYSEEELVYVTFTNTATGCSATTLVDFLNPFVTLSAQQTDFCVNEPFDFTNLESSITPLSGTFSYEIGGVAIANSSYYIPSLNDVVDVTFIDAVNNCRATTTITFDTEIAVPILSAQNVDFCAAMPFDLTSLEGSITAQSGTFEYITTPDNVLYIPNQNSDNVSVINTINGTATATIAVGDGPFGVSLSPDNSFVYISNEYAGTLSVIAASTNTVIATIPVGTSPKGILCSPDGMHVYVANSGSNTVSVISTMSNTVTTTISVGLSPRGLVITPDGESVYVTNLTDDTVDVINTSSNSVVATIGVGDRPHGICISADGTNIYVANLVGDSVSKISTATNTVTATIPVGDAPYSASITPDGAYVYTTDYNENSVSVINTTTNSVSTNIPVGVSPFGSSMNANGSTLYITNTTSNTVSVINTGSNTVINTFSTGNSPLSFGNFVQSGIPLMNPESYLPFAGEVIRLTFTDATTGCSASTTITFGVERAVSTLTAQNTDFCIGRAFDLTSLEGSITPQSGTYQYAIGGTPIANPSTFIPTDNDVVDVTFTDSFGACVVATTITFSGAGIIPPTVSPQTLDFCSGVNFDLTSLQSNITMESGTFQYASNAISITDPSMYNPSEGNVVDVIFMSASTGCSTSITITFINEIALLTAQNVDFCLGLAYDMTTLESSIAEESGTFQYSIGGTPINNPDTYIPSGNEVVDVSFTDDVLGCISMTTIGFNIGIVPPTLTAQTLDFCNDVFFDLTNLESSITTAIGTFSYAFSGIPIISPSLFEPSESDIVEVTFIDDTGICALSTTITFQNELSLSVALNAQSVDLCGTQEFDLTTLENSITTQSGTFEYNITSKPKLYIPNNTFNGSVRVLDMATNSIIATILTSVGRYPDEITISADGSRAYVNSQTYVSVINTATNTVLTTINIDSRGLALSPDDAFLYVADNYNDRLEVFETTGYTSVATIPVGDFPNGVSVSPDGLYVQVVNYNSDSVSIIDAITNTVIATVPVGRVFKRKEIKHRF